MIIFDKVIGPHLIVCRFNVQGVRERAEILLYVGPKKLLWNVREFVHLDLLGEIPMVPTFETEIAILPLKCHISRVIFCVTAFEKLFSVFHILIDLTLFDLMQVELVLSSLLLVCF